jgi:myo-inositol-1(or 4)-monophosphatase
MHHPLLNIAFRAARNASKIIVRSFERVEHLRITEKQPNDFVTEVDKLAEQEIINTVRELYPHHLFLGEESGSSGGGGDNSEYVWIIDPLDGTVNYIHGHPHFSMSIAVQRNGIVECGLVYDPLRQEIFTAARGNGAYFNRKRIRVSARKQLHGALLGMAFAHDDSHYLQAYINMLRDVEMDVAAVRRSGSSALDLAYVACGRLDAFTGFNLKSWDVAAGALLVSEAGGVVSDFVGGNNYLESGGIIAANPKLFRAVQGKAKEALANLKA